MDQEILELYLPSGDPARGKREASEWLDLKSRVEEDKFRKLSADLERRRARRFLYHSEEERKVVKELNNLQRDRLRFEREKQLRQRNSFSSSSERRHSTRKPLSEVNTQLLMNQKSFGGSASLAFDPTLEKSSRPSRRTGKEQTVSYDTVRKASKDLSASNSSPYLDEEDVRQFHKLCKSAAKSECRLWGAAWFYAKKEQDIAEESKKRWTAPLLKTEKEKMRILSEKGVALLEFGLERNLQSGNFGNDTRNTSKNARAENGVKMPDKKGKKTPKKLQWDIQPEDKRLTCHKAFSLPQAIAREQEEESSTDEVSQNKSRLSSVDCKHITSSLLKEGAQEKDCKRSKKS